MVESRGRVVEWLGSRGVVFCVGASWACGWIAWEPGVVSWGTGRFGLVCL